MTKMFIFAHIFAGALLGLGILHLTNDRRAVPFCIAGSILPDLIDKSLGFLFPLVLGSGRTVFHSLGSVILILFGLVVFVRFNQWLLNIGIVSAILLHQVFDEMWIFPSNWFYPLLGPFQGFMIPDYVGTYFWFEITNPSEWMFMFGSVLILAVSYQKRAWISLPSFSDRMKTVINTFVLFLSLGLGFYLVAAGLISTTGTIITPLYNQVTTVIAGLLPVCGAVIMTLQKK
jgi:hypothetical protein